jgi:hypothetical protein
MQPVHVVICVSLTAVLNKGLIKAQIQVHLVNMLYYFMPNNLNYASNEMVK